MFKCLNPKTYVSDDVGDLACLGINLRLGDPKGSSGFPILNPQYYLVLRFILSFLALSLVLEYLR
jgi:hypothetical protein